MKTLSLISLGLMAAILPLTAAAQEAVASKWVNLRAGPARDYPLVLQVAPGTPLAVEGCTDGYGWCDVMAPGYVRGWVYAGNLSYPYQDAQVPILEYGALIGFPIATFVIGDYWGQHYRNRPWFGDRSRWAQHAAPPGGGGRRGRDGPTGAAGVPRPAPVIGVPGGAPSPQRALGAASGGRAPMRDMGVQGNPMPAMRAIGSQNSSTPSLPSQRPPVNSAPAPRGSAGQGMGQGAGPGNGGAMRGPGGAGGGMRAPAGGGGQPHASGPGAGGGSRPEPGQGRPAEGGRERGR